MARLALTLPALLLLLAAQAGAQPRYPGAADEPMALEAPKKDKGPGVTPLAVALSLCFEPAEWTKLGVSTSPVIEMARLLHTGHYRLEILQLALLASESGKDFPALAARRDKGETLKQLAQSLSADFDGIYDKALRMAEDVDRWEERVRSVDPLERGEPGSGRAVKGASPARLPGMEGAPPAPGASYAPGTAGSGKAPAARRRPGGSR